MSIILGYSLILSCVIVSYVHKDREIDSWLTFVAFTGLVILLMGVKQLLLYDGSHTFGIV